MAALHQGVEGEDKVVAGGGGDAGGVVLQPEPAGARERREKAGDEIVLVYTADADTLTERVRESGLKIDNTVYRQAGLEDVYLRLTGRSLTE